MKRLRNTLAVLSDGAYVHAQDNTLIISADGDKKKLPVNLFDTVITFGNQAVSTEAMRLISNNGVALSFMTRHERSPLRLDGGTIGSVLLRKAQWSKYFDEQQRLELARFFVMGKIVNQRRLVNRQYRNYSNDSLLITLDKLKISLEELLVSTSVKDVMLCEANAANAYWSAFKVMLRISTMEFNGRSKHPPRDEVNALLSFLYVLLCNDCAAMLHAVGFDEQCGYLHSLRSGRASLACDLMEELRTPVVDRFVLRVFNLKQMNSDDFERAVDGVYLTPDGIRKVYNLLNDWRRVNVHHSVLDEDVQIGELAYIQARMLARYVYGEDSTYRAFVAPR